MVARENLRLGLEAGGGGLPGPADLALNQSRGLLQTPVVDLRTPGTPKSSLDILPSSNGTSTNGSNPGITSNNSNGGAPTLTTPTLTPTTLRNIEQMFAESDPHEPPHHYEHAAGFAPPIISPTSGNSYAPLGGGSSSGPQQVAPLNCHRSTPPPPAIPGPPDLCPLPTKPLQRPTNLSLSRPPPLLEAPTRRPTCLLPHGGQSTPDILRDNNTKRPQTELEQEKAEETAKEEEKEAEEKQEDTVKEALPLPVPKDATPEVASKEGSQEVEELPNNEEVREKKIITSEEEAKAR